MVLGMSVVLRSHLVTSHPAWSVQVCVVKIVWFMSHPPYLTRDLRAPA